MHEPGDAEPFSPYRMSLPKNSDPSPPQQVPKKSTFWVPPRFTVRDLLHEPRGDDDAFLTERLTVFGANPGTYVKRTCKKIFGKAPSRITKA